MPPRAVHAGCWEVRSGNASVGRAGGGRCYAKYLRIDLISSTIERCAALARQFYVSHGQQRDVVAASRVTATSTPMSRMTLTPVLRRTLGLTEWLRPQVEGLRRALFDGVSAVPFATLDDAATWIEHQAKHQERPRTGPDHRGREVLLDAGRAAVLLGRADQRAREAARLLGATFTVTTESRSLFYAKSSVSTGFATVPIFRMRDDSPPLWSLETECRIWAETCGFAPVAVLAYVLAGVAPLTTTPVEIQHTRRPRPHASSRAIAGTPTRTEVTVTLRAALTFDQLRDLHRALQAAFGLAQAPKATDKRLMTWEVVEQLGGAPKRPGVTAFFRDQVCPRICGTAPRSRSSLHWRTHQKRYEAEQARRQTHSEPSTRARRRSVP